MYWRIEPKKQAPNGYYLHLLRRHLQAMNREVETNAHDYLYSDVRSRDRIDFKNGFDIEFMNINFDDIPRCGIYLLGDFYVGKSGYLPDRIKTHFYNSLKNPDPKISSVSPINHRLNYLIYSRVFQYNKPVPVAILSDDWWKEKFWIKKIRDMGFPLLNRIQGEHSYTGRAQ